VDCKGGLVFNDSLRYGIIKQTNMNEIKTKKHWYKRWWGILIIVLIPIFATFLPLYIYQLVVVYDEIKGGTYIDLAEFEKSADYDMSAVIDPMAPWIGAKDAKIVIVEFGDFNCPYCLQEMPILKQVLAKYKDKVKISWRNFPTTQASSLDFAYGAVCANRQGKFWVYHDIMFANQGQYSVGSLGSVATGLGVDLETFNSCLENPLTQAEVRKDYLFASDYNLQGTPTFFINGFKLQGIVPYESWEKIIDQLLTIYE
jgi:protein-disulfide isomerase